MIEEFVRWFLALFFSAVCAFYVIRINLLTARLKQKVTYLGAVGSLHHLTHMTFRVFRIIIFAVCLVRVPFPALDQYLFLIGGLQSPYILLSGCALLIASFGGLVAVNLYMNGHWRSGTDPGDQSELITGGPFAVSQNPMMLLVMTGQLGFFLALPSAFTFICLVAGHWAVISQVSVEQTALREKFGDAYLQYTASTPRWLLR